MKLSKVSLCAAVALGAMTIANAAAAQVAFNAGIATSYTFRGVRQTVDSHNNSTVEAFGGIDWSGGPNLYAGAWISNTGHSNSNGIETDFYGGWKPKAGPVTFDLGVIYYTYNNSNDGFVTNDLNTLEWKAGASMAAGPAVVGAAVYFSDDYISSGDSSTYWEINGSIPVKKDVVLSGAIGSLKAKVFKSCGFSCSNTDSYMTWNLGVTVPITDKVSLDARYIGTDKDATKIWGNFAADDQLIGTIKATF
ncbi:MAG TPA: TorF family putative porin [Caulobacteraceae bacterium]|nr:TorF family putative porin [Caulobacteraceae bacterium]